MADPERRLRLAGKAPAARALLDDQYRFDEVYEEAFIQPGRDLGDALTNGVERYGVQGSLEGVVRGVHRHGPRPAGAPDRPRARLRLRDGRRRRGRRRHLQPGDALMPWVSRHRAPAAPRRAVDAVRARGPGRRRAGADPRDPHRRRHRSCWWRSWSASSTATPPACSSSTTSTGPSRPASPGTWAWTASRCGSSPSRPRIFLLAIVAACWRLPERPRAFLAMLLLAEAGLLGLFAAGDLVLFYVFWEAMLIPFYFLIGMWGGEGRARATTQVRHLHDGRQPADAGVDPGDGLRGPGHHRAVHLLDPRPGRRRLHRHPEHLALRRLRPRLRDQAAPVALPRLAARRLPRRADPGDRACWRP